MTNKIILGTAQFGLNYGINNHTGKPSEKQVINMLEYAAKQGVQVLDTADAYGNAMELIGSFNKHNPCCFLFNTKFNNAELPIRQQLNTALEILHAKHVNTYFYHRFEDFILHPELLTGLLELKKENKILKIGLSVYDNFEFKEAIDAQEIDVIQLPFNLFDNFKQRGELIQHAKECGKELQVRSVFLQGLFFKNPNEIPSNLKQLLPHLIKVKELSKEFDVKMDHLSLGYALYQPAIDHVIIGADNIEQLRRNLLLASKSIDSQLIYEVNQIVVKETELLYPKNWT